MPKYYVTLEVRALVTAVDESEAKMRVITLVSEESEAITSVSDTVEIKGIDVICITEE
jgi:hypothetical protein